MGNIWVELHFPFKRILKPVKHCIKGICQCIDFIISFTKVYSLWQIISFIYFFSGRSYFFNRDKCIFSYDISNYSGKNKKKWKSNKRNCDDSFHGLTCSNSRHYTTNPNFSISLISFFTFIYIPFFILMFNSLNTFFIWKCIIVFKIQWIITVYKSQVFIIHWKLYSIYLCFHVIFNDNFTIYDGDFPETAFYCTFKTPIFIRMDNIFTHIENN